MTRTWRSITGGSVPRWSLTWWAVTGWAISGWSIAGSMSWRAIPGWPRTGACRQGARSIGSVSRPCRFGGRPVPGPRTIGKRSRAVSGSRTIGACGGTVTGSRTTGNGTRGGPVLQKIACRATGACARSIGFPRIIKTTAGRSTGRSARQSSRPAGSRSGRPTTGAGAGW